MNSRGLWFYIKQQLKLLLKGYFDLDMVGVVGSNPIAPTNRDKGLVIQPLEKNLTSSVRFFYACYLPGVVIPSPNVGYTVNSG